MIRFVAFALGNSLLRSASSRNSLHLRIGMLIQKFRNCTDWLRMLDTYLLPPTWLPMKCLGKVLLTNVHHM